MMLLWLAGFPALAATELRPEKPPSAAARVLERARLQKGELDPDWLEERLLTRSAGSLEPLAIALAGHSADCSATRECTHLEIESAERLRVALRSLALEVGARARQLAAGSPDRRELSQHGLDLCALAGTEKEFELIVTLATAVDGRSVDEALAARLQHALSSILARCPKAYAEVEAGLDELPLSTLSRVLAAVGSQDSSRALRLLPAFLDRDPNFDTAVMSYISKLATRHPNILDELQIDSLRGRLSVAEAALRRQAAEALGWLKDAGSVALLIDLLLDENRGVQRSAQWALGRITGLTMEAGDPRWRTWFEAELTWWEERAGTVRHALAGGSDGQVVAALQELSLHRLHAAETAEWLEPLVRDRRPMVASRACSTLGAFGRPSSVASLTTALEHPDARTRRAAHQALREITTWELPPRAAAWRRAFQQGGPKASSQDRLKTSR